MGKDATPRRDLVRETAALWVVRLSDPSTTAEDRAVFERWRGENPLHEVAFERESVAWDRLARLRVLASPGAAPDPDLLAPKRAGRFIRYRSAARGWAAAACITLTVAGLAAVAIDLTAGTAYATAVGEHRVVVLADGSRLELNTNTKVVVRYRRGVRETRIIRGEVMFDIVKDTRPFVVIAPQKRIVASSSQLAVRVLGGSEELIVKSGAVSVGGVAQEPVTELPTDTEAFYGPRGAAVRRVSVAEIDRSLAWRQGAVAFNGQTLAEAVDEFNRYNSHHLIITDDSIATLRVAGYFQSTDLPGFVQALSSAFPIKAEEAADGSIHLSRAG